MAMSHLENDGEMEKYQEYFDKSMDLFKKISHTKTKFETMYHTHAIKLLKMNKIPYAMTALKNLLDMRIEIYGEDNSKVAEVYEILGKVSNV